MCDNRCTGCLLLTTNYMHFTTMVMESEQKAGSRQAVPRSNGMEQARQSSI